MSREYLRSKVVGNVKRFAQNTTAHGLSHFIEARNVYFSVFWCAVILGAGIGFSTHLALLVVRYQSRPTSTSINPIGAEFEYPQITFCNKEPITISSYAEFEKLDKDVRQYYYADNPALVIKEEAKPIWKFAYVLENLILPETARNDSCYEYLASHTYDGDITERGCGSWKYSEDWYRTHPESFPDNNIETVGNKCRDVIKGFHKKYNYTFENTRESLKLRTTNNLVYYTDGYLGCYKNKKILNGTIRNPFNLKECAKSCWMERHRFMAVIKLNNGTVCSCGNLTDFWENVNTAPGPESKCETSCGDDWPNETCAKRIYTISIPNGKPWCITRNIVVPKRKMLQAMDELPKAEESKMRVVGAYKICETIPLCDTSTLPYKYIGCFYDGPDSDFSYLIQLKPLSVAACARACRIKGYIYIGLHRGLDCHCGNSYGKYGKALERSCWCKCGDKCGGYQFNSVYSIKANATEDSITRVSHYLTDKIRIIRRILLDTFKVPVWSHFTLSPEKFILNCKIGEAVCSYEDFIQFYSRDHLRCFTFDVQRFYKNNPKLSREKTPTLDVLFYTDSLMLDRSKVPILYKETGTRVFYRGNPGTVIVHIHRKGTFPHRSSRYEATSGFKTKFKLKQTVIETVRTPKNNCSESSEKSVEYMIEKNYNTTIELLASINNSTDHDWFAVDNYTVTREDCADKIMTAMIMEKCDCVLNHLPLRKEHVSSNKSYCFKVPDYIEKDKNGVPNIEKYIRSRNLTVLDLLEKTYTKMECVSSILKKELTILKNHCPVSCKTVEYSVYSSVSSWPGKYPISKVAETFHSIISKSLNRKIKNKNSTEITFRKQIYKTFPGFYMTTFKSKYASTENSYKTEADKTAQNNFVRVVIDPISDNAEVIQEEFSYPLMNLFADLGGSLGLWVGISLITLAEIFELLQHLVKAVILYCRKYCDQRKISRAKEKKISSIEEDNEHKESFKSSKI